MDASRIEIEPGVWLDSRRAVYLADERTLCVADLHLGYAWAHRFSGQMLPLRENISLAERLCDLCSFYKPEALAVLGDIVHQAVPVAEVSSEFTDFVRRVRDHCGLKLILGNHDRNLKKLAPELAGLEFHDCWPAGKFLLVHGNEECQKPPGTKILMGHEHPAISLGDTVRSAKFPCFLYSREVIVLPAFSDWASGSDVRSCRFMSPLARTAKFKTAIAILGEKLLKVKLAD